MKEYRFKTNINCGGCIAKATPFLDTNADIKQWKADTSTPDKILTVETDNLREEDILEILQKAGFKAEIVS